MTNLVKQSIFINNHIVNPMYRNKVITTSLDVLAVATAISLLTASTGGGLVISAFAAKKGSDPSDTSSSKKNTSSASSFSTGTKSKFIKCVTALSGSISKAEVDNCWNQVFESGSVTGLTLGSSTGSSSSSSGHSSGNGVSSTGASST
jgi:hypothetical protein